MTLTGSNWQPGESVHINVNDDQGKTWSRDVDVTADASGNITDQFQLPSTFVAVYKVTATGAQSGVAVTYFTDGNVRFTTSTSAVSFVATWERYSTNNCTGTKVSLPPPNTANSGSDTVQNAAGQSLTVVANTGNYVKLTAPLTEDGQTFTGWTATGNATFTTSGSNGETICAAGDDTGLSSFTANYTAADTTPPAAPSLELNANSDSGISNSDNVTNDSTPTFNGTAEAGSSVSVLVDGVEKGTGTASGGSYSITTSALSDGSRSVTVKATDVTGNVSVESNSLSVTIDTQAPVITFNVNNTTVNNNGQYYFGSVPSAPTCSASDALSGLDGSCSVGGYGTTVGSHTVTATANDKAGNTNSASITYSVLAWTLKGFYSPVDYDTATAKVWNTVKGGATVPLKFEVFAGSTELTDPAVVDRFTATGVVCPGANAATDDIEITTTGGTQLRYDATGGQFIQNWQTPKKPGSCYDVSMITDDGTKLPVARFMLK